MKKHYFAFAAGLGLLAGVAGAQTNNGYLYYVGGGIADSGNATTEDGTLTTDNGVFSVLVADVAIGASNVSVNNWRYAAGVDLGNPLPADNPNTVDTEAYSWMFLENACHIYDGRIYVGPGDWNVDGSRSTADVVIHADINPDGTLGAWTFSDVFPVPEGQAICATALVDFGGGNAYYYVLGGTGSGTDRVLVSKIQANGTLGPWSTTTALPEGDWFNRATAVGDTIVHATGNLATSLRATHYATASSADGTLSAWTSSGSYQASPTAQQWDMAIASLSSPDDSDFVVIAGGNAADGKVFVSEVTAGVPGTWVEQATTLPTPVRRVAGNGWGDVMFVLGGTAGGSGVTVGIDDVQIGRINDAGVVTWSTSDTTSSIMAMPQARSFGGTAFEFTEFVEAPANAEGVWTVYE
ncbi:MAG: hypothetical protein PWP23_2632 [Candidatus Sumerlaeota bacterium]|nr:hypothetical protein [Candidatus Sumerlaeota bacterium]